MDLVGGYLLILSILFVACFSLLLGNKKIDNSKLIILSLGIAIFSFALFNLSTFLNGNLEFLLGYFSYFFIILSMLLFAVLIYYIKKDNLKITMMSVVILYIVSAVALSSQAKLTMFDYLLYSLFIFITTFAVYQLTKLLVHAKREYPAIIGEFMSLFSILIFIFGLTYFSTFTLDYKMFSPFLILTPTYQLIYVIIFIVAVLVIGVVYNDNKGGNS